MSAKTVLRNTPAVVGFGQIRLQSKRRVVILDGNNMLAKVALRVASVVVGFGIVRLQLKRRIVVLYRRFMLAKLALCDASVVVGFGIAWLQADGFVIGIYRRFEIWGFTIEISDGEPCPSLKSFVRSLRDVGDRTPLFEGLLDFSLLLKQDSNGHGLVYRGCRGILSNTFRSLASLIRVFTDSLRVQSRYNRLSLLAFPFDLIDKAPGFFCMLLGQHHILAGFAFDFAERLEADIADNDGDNTNQRQKYGRSGEPPIDELYTTFKNLAPEIVETDLPFDINSLACTVRRGCQMFVLGFISHTTFSTCFTGIGGSSFESYCLQNTFRLDI